MGLATKSWSPLIHHIIIKKLDRATHNLYEQSLKDPKEIPSIDGLLKFLETRFQSLEAVGSNRTTGAPNKVRAFAYSPRASLTVSKETPRGRYCRMCKKDHPLYACEKFISLTPHSRVKQVKLWKLCMNCLKDGHHASNCPSRHCTKCQQYHNTLLHQDVEQRATTASNQTSSDQKKQTSARTSEPTTGNQLSPTNLAAATSQPPSPAYVFLATAVVHVLDSCGNLIEGRAVLDSGSQLNFITERFCRKLGVQPRKHHLNIVGIGDSGLTTQGRVNLQIQSRICNFSTRMEAFVLPKIASPQPSCYTDITDWPIPQNIQLADPRFNLSSSVDLLIGAEHYCSLLAIGQIRLNSALPTLQNTVLGWVLTGKALPQNSATPFCGIGNQSSDNLNAILERFWEIEEPNEPEKCMTPAERHCEELFKTTTTRETSGRYTVRLPLKQDPSELGESWDIAIRRFLSLEKRLVKNPDLKQQYMDFIHEYISLNHMEEASNVDLNEPHYFLPHHCVLKPESSTTKLRVVFDASAKTTKNVSLNDILYKGSKTQDDLFSILLRFRTHRYVFTSDITKMYRQIWINKADQNLQLIIWRDKPQDKLKMYRLKTITYGTTSAPYLATRCLQQLAEDEKERFPVAATIVKRDFYVDDIMTGGDSIEEVLIMQSQLIRMMNAGGFPLRKWCANHPQILKIIPKEDREHEIEIDKDPEAYVKTLGITWHPTADIFSLKTSWKEAKRVTKRTVISDIAHLFDPLGFVNPVIVSAKIFMQELWSLKLDWDAALPVELHTRWLTFRQGLTNLNNIKIPRHMITIAPVNIQLHAFSDASERAYGSVLYLRSVDADGNIIVRLVCAKSRVAPRKTITLPRLELCAAKLMAQLVDKFKRDICITIHSTTYWTDSQIVLSWLQAESSVFKTFVANRVASIQKLSSVHQWRHISTKLNPADLVSRGATPEQLLSSTLWFNGPPFLQKSELEFPHETFKASRVISEERQIKTILTTATEEPHFIQCINHKNSFRYLQRVVAYIIRFYRNSRKEKGNRISSRSLRLPELNEALTVIIKEMQNTAFKEELRELERNRPVSKSSPLTNFTVFLDTKGIIRVGGRLHASNLPYNAKHQIILPQSHTFTKMIMTQLHVEHLHVGPQGLLAITRQRFWPLGGRQLAQTVVHQCIRCFKVQPRGISQLMGNLPAERVQPSRPFLNVGVDYLGPILIHYKLRGKRPTKAYVAVFVCFATKAVHFEVVSDLTTAAFIGALKRFIARRGAPAKIFSDNATNFMGARNEFKELSDLLHGSEHQEAILEHCSYRGIEWNPIPARSPHIGGLWEAAVKMAKYHLKRVLGSASLTFEELSTVVTQAEAVLNSRPLTPMSSNPEDMQVLTPGHFLIGEPLTTLADPEAKPNNVTLLHRWNLVKSIQHEFWRRWSAEYLQELQSRYKWKYSRNDIEPGTLVLLKEENLPPLSWKMGRVLKVYKGQDGHVRIVDIRTPNGETKRSIHRICPLPIQSDTDQGDAKGDEFQHSTSSESPQDMKTKLRSHSKQSPHPLKGRFLPINSNWTKAKTEISASISDPNFKRKADEEPYKTQPDTPKRAKSSKLMSMLNVLLLTAFVFPALGEVTKTPFEITTFDAQTGVYLEDTGRVDLVVDEWNLVVYFDITNYWLEANELQKLVKRMQNLCRLIDSHKDLCRAIIKDFEHELTVLQQTNHLLKGNDTPSSRSRRSPFNFVGTITNRLFGILDQEYADHIENIIAQAQGNEDHLLHLIRNQTTLIESTQNIIKKDEEYIDQQFVTINNYLQEFRSIIHTIDQESREQQALQLFNALSTHTSLILSHFRKMQTALIEAVTDTHHGRVNPLLITPDQLKTELSKIRDNLPPTTRFPIKDQSDLQQLYKLITARVRATSKNIIFSLSLPLVSNKIFTMYNIVPLPTSHDNSKIIIQSPAKYVIVDLHRESFYAIPESEFLSCTTITPQQHLCHQKRPIYSKEASEEHCEIALFLQDNNIPQDCIITPDTHSSHWIPLHHPNQWIFCLNTEIIITIVCNSLAYQQKLNGKGLLKLNAACIIKHRSVTFNSQFSTATKVMTSLTSLTSNIGPMNFSPRERELQLLTLRNNSEILTTLARRVAEIKTQQQLPHSLSFHDTHQFVISYTALGIIIILIFIYCYLRCCRKRQANIPQPAPRREFQKTTDTTFELREFKAGESG